jgi:hypothetical protein
MKTKLLIPVVFLFAVLSSTCVQAQTYGDDISVKVDYFHFSDSQIKRLNASDGVYVGVEAYRQLFCPGLSFGLAIGWAGTSGSVAGPVQNPLFLPLFVSADSNIDYVPIEFNIKYVIPVSRCLNFAFGGGGSINYFSISSNTQFGGLAVNASDSNWVWGGQVFGELNYRISNWFIGADVKYQLTQDLSLFGIDTQAGADNFRAGGHIGFSF